MSGSQGTTLSADPRHVSSSPSLNPIPCWVVLCAREKVFVAPHGMLLLFARKFVRIQGSHSFCRSASAPCQARQITSRCALSHHQRLQRTGLHVTSIMSATVETDSSAAPPPAGDAPPAEEPADASAAAAKGQASAGVPEEEDRLKIIKDHMFWTHGSQVKACFPKWV